MKTIDIHPARRKLMKMSKVQLSDEMVEHLLPIPTSMMIADLQEAKEDMKMCRIALRAGIVTYGHGKKTLHRLISDCRRIAVMRAELARRGVNIIDLDYLNLASNLLDNTRDIAYTHR